MPPAIEFWGGVPLNSIAGMTIPGAGMTIPEGGNLIYSRGFSCHALPPARAPLRGEPCGPVPAEPRPATGRIFGPVPGRHGPDRRPQALVVRRTLYDFPVAAFVPVRPVERPGRRHRPQPAPRLPCFPGGE